MTAPPLPASPCIRVRLNYTQTDGLKGGNRLFFTYAGSAPTAANCAAIADALATAWSSDIAPIVCEDWDLSEIDVLDIATNSGLSGQWTGSEGGSRSGVSLPAQCATNIEFNIARRYRGGKPRVFLPPPTTGDLLNPSTWTGGFTTAANTGWTNFVTAAEAIDVGAVGALQHVNLSYYEGFTNIMNSSGRERAVPTYRTTAKVDTISGYSVKSEIGSQKRRRTATAA